MTDAVPFHKGGAASAPSGGHTHTHDANEHGHTHEVMEHAGKFGERDIPNYTHRNWNERAFTVGIGGYVALLTQAGRLRQDGAAPSAVLQAAR